MLVRLLGVLEDGLNRAVDVPLNPRRTLRVPRGASVTLEVQVLRPDGSAADLTGSTLVLSVKKNSLQYDVLPGVRKTGAIDSAAPNVARFTLLPADTLGLEPGTFVYDVWRTAGDGSRDPVVVVAPFVLEPAVTLP